MNTPPRPGHRAFPDSSPESLRRLPGGPFNYSHVSPRTPADEADATRGQWSPWKNPAATFSQNSEGGDVIHQLDRTLWMSCLLSRLTDYEASIYAPLGQFLGTYLSVYKEKTNKTETCLITCPQGVVHNLPPEWAGGITTNSNLAGSLPGISWATEIAQQDYQQVDNEYRQYQPSDDDDDVETMGDIFTVTRNAKKKVSEAENQALKKRPRVIPDFNGIVIERRVDTDQLCDTNIIFTVEIKPPKEQPQSRRNAIRKLANGQVHTQVAYIFTQKKHEGDYVPAIIVYGLYWTYAEFDIKMQFNTLRVSSEIPAAVAHILQKLMSDSKGLKVEGEPGSERKAEPELDYEMRSQESEEEGTESEPVDHEMRSQESDQEAEPERREHEMYMEQLLVAVSILTQEEVASELSRILRDNTAGIAVHTWESKYALTLAAMRIQHLYPLYWRDRRLGETKKEFVHGKSVAQSIMESKIRHRERVAQLEKQVQELEAKLKSAMASTAGFSAGKLPGKGAGMGKTKQGGK
ncbi:uncharacterized protein TRAVEDRAFT_24107 [Trametes versicolor FP-101664 SS1]|uniref:uncharacterized protein n=1 Tax=Trametes versicolor (strain FP-101664) TaxID=717944 RepID=UPI0004622C2B|nr:uncharacterized protein TRAVEDRAFT_24107 [Trametes versicolor FP-101664 SS1]EIW52638.1 hypothetical protein TRAVEDRAFT_24107 [Trametes versicolor FP-101664 SS1]